MTKKFHRAALVGVVVVAWLGCGVAQAQAQGLQGERGGLGLRPIFLPQDRPGGEISSFVAESPRRQDGDEARNPRRLSPEERRQLRRDVQDAGRDVYGNPPRRSD